MCIFSFNMSWLISLVTKLLPVVVSVVVSIDCCLTFVVVTVVVVSMFELFEVDFSVITVVVVSMFELIVVDFSVVTVVVVSMFELIVVIFSEQALVGNFAVHQMLLSFWLSVLLSSEHHSQFVTLVNGHFWYRKYWSCVEYKWKYCFYVLYFQAYKEQQSVSFAF